MIEHAFASSSRGFIARLGSVALTAFHAVALDWGNSVVQHRACNSARTTPKCCTHRRPKMKPAAAGAPVSIHRFRLHSSRCSRYDAMIHKKTQKEPPCYKQRAKGQQRIRRPHEISRGGDLTSQDLLHRAPSRRGGAFSSSPSSLTPPLPPFSSALASPLLEEAC